MGSTSSISMKLFATKLIPRRAKISCGEFGVKQMNSDKLILFRGAIMARIFPQKPGVSRYSNSAGTYAPPGRAKPLVRLAWTLVVVVVDLVVDERSGSRERSKLETLTSLGS